MRGDSIISLRHKELLDLVERLAAASGYVKTLRLQQLPSHLDLEVVLARLSKLTAIELTYG